MMIKDWRKNVLKKYGSIHALYITSKYIAWSYLI